MFEKMLRDKYHRVEVNTKADVIQENKLIAFVDGEGFDHFLQIVLKGLYIGILFFCIPYFCYLFFTLIF